MVESIEDVPEIERNIMRFILKQRPTWVAHYPEIGKEELKKSSRYFGDKVMSMSRSLYRDNIPSGNETTQYRLSFVLGLGLLGSLLGAATGFGADLLVEKYVAPSFRSRRTRKEYPF